MPNWVANRISIIGSDDAVKKVVAFVKSDESVFDFNKIIPRPEALNIESGSYGTDGMEYIIAMQKPSSSWSESERKLIERMDGYSEEARENRIALGRQYLDNIAKYGYPTWYEWSRAKWGTKWREQDVQYLGDGVFVFDTAWSAPLPVLTRLSELFPDVSIDFMYSDEDCSYNTGEGQICKGELEGNFPEGNTPDGWRLFFELHDWAREEMHQDENGNWVWND